VSGDRDRWQEFHVWIRQLRKEVSIEEIINRVLSRMQNTDAEDQPILESHLRWLLIEAGRYDEVLRLIDSGIERKPNGVRYPIEKATLYYYYLKDLEEALRWIDFALERAFRTRVLCREALGTKARILLDLGRGEELGQVLEQIMSLDMFEEIPDVGKERDFVDRAPPGLIRDDIVARYDKFYPKHDPALDLHRWVRELQSQLPVEAVIDQVQSRMQSAIAEDKPTLAYILAMLLAETGQYADAVRLFDSVLEQQPDQVRPAIRKATMYLDFLDDAETALGVIDLALERAFRTGFYRRQALGEKARILLKLQRGEELGQVLEQIMSLKMYPEVRDIGRERVFVDRAPPGLIPEDIVVRYNAFCPRMDEDSR
jgi:tetratricopeptide (TPR) repeat protein